MVLYALLAVVVNLIPQWYTALQMALGIWGLVAWATVGIGLLHEWYDGVAEGRLNPWLQIAVRFVSGAAIWELCVRLFRSTERVQRSPSDRLDARYHCGGSRRGPGHGAPTRYPYKESCMSNRDGILDSHPSERVKMPPELAAFDRWGADPNDLAKWEAAMAALAPAAGADNSNATVNL